jgi:hypothetical protein
VKHHLPPLGDRQTALSAAFSSIIVDTNVFKSFRVPLHVNLLFVWPKKTVKLAVDKFIHETMLGLIYTSYKSINSKNCIYQFTFFSSVSSHLPVSEVRNYHLG